MSRIAPAAMTDGTDAPTTVTGESSVIAPSTLRAYRESDYRVHVAPPLTLRVDYSETPLQALRDLYGRATTGLYGHWTRHVPTLDDPTRAEPFRELS